MLSFHPFPLPTSMRHKVWGLSIEASILAKVTKLQSRLKDLGTRKFQQSIIYWATPAHLLQKGSEKVANISLILKKYLRRRPREEKAFIHLTEEETNRDDS